MEERVESLTLQRYPGEKSILFLYGMRGARHSFLSSPPVKIDGSLFFTLLLRDAHIGLLHELLENIGLAMISLTKWLGAPEPEKLDACVQLRILAHKSWLLGRNWAGTEHSGPL